MDLFEPTMTARRTAEVFAPLREFTVDLLARLREKTAGFTDMPDTAAAEVETDTAAQKRFCRRVLGAMGFDFDAGRLDEAAHPFCSGIGPGDTRLTNRYRPDGWLDALSGGMHEGGHGLYEQGLPKGERFGSPLAEAVSLGIHESQSRMWENMVGRSPEFWRWALPIAKEALGPALASCDEQAVYRAANLMRPSFIRVESDELTYNLHIMLRFDMERAMLRGDLACADLPGAWNERFEKDWGMPVTDDAVGCLQDVHWSMGAIGYFPTYTLGNLYSAQFWEAIGRDMPDRDERVERGEFGEILAWTRDNIHRHGRRYPAEELAKNATGEGLSHDALARHLEARASAVFGL
jgi:carboxypeptidase Taq